MVERARILLQTANLCNLLPVRRSVGFFDGCLEVVVVRPRTAVGNVGTGVVDVGDHHPHERRVEWIHRRRRVVDVAVERAHDAVDVLVNQDFNAAREVCKVDVVPADKDAREVSWAFLRQGEYSRRAYSGGGGGGVVGGSGGGGGGEHVEVIGTDSLLSGKKRPVVP